jgi:integrase/recombinase XerD
MTPLRQRFIDELTRRNYSPRTIEAYLTGVRRLANHFQRSPAVLTSDHLREFQLPLIRQRVSWSLFNQTASALRFLYTHVLHQPEAVPFIPYGRKPKTLPVVLSPGEVQAVLDVFTHPPTRMIFRTLYACGLRINELIHLRIADIDSGRMLVHVRQGKGQKDRCVPLARRLLDELRTYWRQYRPRDLLFPGQTADGTLCPATLQRHCLKAARRAGLAKHVTPHTFRHCYATHLLEAGVDVPTLQRLLGHSSLSTTLRYLHLRSARVSQLHNPYDLLAGTSAVDSAIGPTPSGTGGPGAAARPGVPGPAPTPERPAAACLA